MTEPEVLLQRRGPVARVTLNRPERRNALSLAMLTALQTQLRAAADDPDTHVVVLGGTGPAFSAGHDLRELVAADATELDAVFVACVDLMHTITALRVPVIARVHGMATAAGCQLVAACDLAVASNTARFATPGVNIGLFCSTPMVPLVRAVGRKRALEMLLTGEPITAKRARKWGLVNRIVPADELDGAVDALATQIAQASPAVVALGKQTFHAQLDLSDAEAYGLTARVMTENAQLPDAREGMAAFLEKRPPVWGTH